MTPDSDTQKLFGQVCTHGQLQRQCPICEYDAQIAILQERIAWFERSGGVDAHTRVFQEMTRAENAEKALAAERAKRCWNCADWKQYASYSAGSGTCESERSACRDAINGSGFRMEWLADHGCPAWRAKERSSG